MKRMTLVRTAIAFVLLAGAGGANAAVLTFSGSMSTFGSAAPDPSCAPLPFRALVSSTNGISSLGNFSYNHNVCLSGISGPSQGSFAIDFGSDAFQGALSGLATPSETPGVVDLLFNYTISSGTGRFLGATGSFTGIGTSNVQNGPPPVINLAFDGAVNASAVPEPGTWATLLVGFGVIGTCMRRRKRQTIRLVA